MHLRTRQYARFLFALLLSVSLGSYAQDHALDFSSSPNGKKAQKTHFDNLTALTKLFNKSVGEADGRFKQTAERDIQRYTLLLQREVRALTRAGQFDAASQAQQALDAANAWRVHRPTFQGEHFLSSANIEVQGSEKATKAGVDLLVDVQKAAVMHNKQLEAAYLLYAKQVADARTGYVGALERVQSTEQRAGRLEAVRQVMAAIKTVEGWQDVRRPSRVSLNEPKPVHRPDPRVGDPGDSDTRVTRPRQGDDDDDEPGSKRPRFFDLGEDDEDQPQPQPQPQRHEPKRHTADADEPEYAGYYRLTYMNGPLTLRRYIIELNAQGGVLHYIAQGAGKDRTHAGLPIKIMKIERDRLIFQHADVDDDITAVHVVNFKDGKPSTCGIWWHINQYDDKPFEPSASGKASVLGNPGGLHPGWKDGVYLAKLTQSMNKAFRPESKTIQFEITVKHGVASITGYNHTANEDKWKKDSLFVFETERQPGKMLLRYDQDEFKWTDLFILQPDADGTTIVKHYWRGDWYNRGDAPSAIGKLTPR